MRECIFIKRPADFKCAVAKNMVLYFTFHKNPQYLGHFN